MARTPEQVLREIVADQIFNIARLAAENDRLNEENQKLAGENKKLNQILTGSGDK